MSSIKTRLSNARSKLLRRGSHTSTKARSIASSAGSDQHHQQHHHHATLHHTPKATSSLRKSLSHPKLPEASAVDMRDDGASSSADPRLSRSEGMGRAASRTESEAEDSLQSRDRQSQEYIKNIIVSSCATPASAPAAAAAVATSPSAVDVPTAGPEIVLEEPTPIPLPLHPQQLEHVRAEPTSTNTTTAAPALDDDHPSELPTRKPPSAAKPIPPDLIRRQSLVTTSNATIIKSLLEPDIAAAAVGTGPPTASDYFAASAAFNPGMMHRKIWVRLGRPSASATLVQIREDDLVDDVRDMILKKYANSLGKSFDAPDVTLRIIPRSDSKTNDRVLGPEEEMCRTLDAYYPGGQNVAEALLIEVPHPRRTPRPSPRPVYFAHHDDSQPYESQSEYFPPMPIVQPSPAPSNSQHERSQLDPKFPLNHPHSISVLSTGNLPPLPSPGSTRRPHHSTRPKYPRHNTASPTALTSVPPSVQPARPAQSRPRHDSSASENTKHSGSGNAPIPTPPAPIDPAIRQNSTPPTPRVASPRPEKKKKKKAIEPPKLPAGLLDGSVPPINVLIVEDNMINLRVLGAFMQRLKVRWQRAVNGKEAVEKWRAGGFHLVLMDIQLPIMNGLEATKEIRRLERVNSIGVFSSGSNEAPNNRLTDGKYDRNILETDRLGDKMLFKSPVIIVALTASSLQSDRHEALAAGCNDFLTKPVNFVWLERKVKEWGCMQALIDFDGWRKWKDFAAGPEDGASKLSASFTSYAPRSKSAAALSPNLAANTPAANGGPLAKSKDEEKKNKRRSLGVVPPPILHEEDSGTQTPEVDSSGG